MPHYLKRIPTFLACLVLLFCMACAEGTDTYVLTSVYSTIKTETDKGFSKEITLDNNDLHYGWNLGEFYIQGCNAMKTSENGMPVLMMKGKDQISLGFTLKQDLNALNGNTQYTISEDTNGSDDTFKIPKQNFGKGCLIVQRKDANGQISTQYYTDYLSKVAAGSSDAMIVLPGEGRYDVALDYEIKYPGNFGASNFNNYKVPFSFTVVPENASAAAGISPDQVNRWIIIGAVVLTMLIALSGIFFFRNHHSALISESEVESTDIKENPISAERHRDRNLFSFLVRNKKAGILVILFLIGIILCYTVLQPWLTNPSTYSEPVKYLDDKLVKATLLSAGTTSASVLITMIPDDVGTPVANELAQVSGYMMLVLSAIMLEKILVTSFGYLAASFIFPFAFILGIVAVFLRSEYKRKLIAHAIRLFIFGICIVLIIPLGCTLGNRIEDMNAEAISISIGGAKEANTIVETKLPKEESNLSVFQKAVQSIWNGLQEMLSWMKDLITHFMTTIAILLVTTVAIPILILLMFVWAIRFVTGKDYINAFVSLTKRISTRYASGLNKTAPAHSEDVSALPEDSQADDGEPKA